MLRRLPAAGFDGGAVMLYLPSFVGVAHASDRRARRNLAR